MTFFCVLTSAVRTHLTSAFVLVCPLMGSPAMADPSHFGVKLARWTGSIFAQKFSTLSLRERRREGGYQHGWRSLSSLDDGEPLCRPDPRPFNRRAPEFCTPKGDLGAALAELDNTGTTS